MTTTEYLYSINQRYQLGNATEHTFRGDLGRLLETLLPDVRVTNEPKRFQFGAPDYILTKKDIPVGFIEAKDIGDQDLYGKKKAGHKEQFDRYKKSLDNLIFTDYLKFVFYREGELITEIAIGSVDDGKIQPLPENFPKFENLIKNFTTHVTQSIRSPKKLAEMMAGKARLLFDVLNKSLTGDEEDNQDSSLKEQMQAFEQILIHNIQPAEFADIYAQTIAYGMFAARLHDTSLENFSRQEAAELIPKSNPFLRRLFGYIAGPDIDDRIKWIVDDLAKIFLYADVEQVLKNYGKSTQTEDPIIHFYETFLSEYDPRLRKARGVWYTPQPVVNFIVRAVDEILKTEFDLPQGLADTSKTTIKVDTQNYNNRKKAYDQVEKEVHKVQILDPATGTGTFLAEVVKHIFKKFKGQEGIWGEYVKTHLLPRLNGFELLMASYAMAHLKLDLLLKETGYNHTDNQRFRVFLTNSLEEHHEDTGTLFANWLSAEANEANQIKRDTPVMCVIGNPPYSGESANKGKWIMDLMEDYKMEPGGKEKLKERNPKWINDDYVKFIRYGQHLIEKNGSGVLAFINPHGFLDNPTFRGMRWNLLKTYDKIYTIDLHGNATKKETAPDGSIDENVFDIRQGVSINFFIKTGKKKANELGQVFHFDLYGKREDKYQFLMNNSVSSIEYTELPNIEPNYFFVEKDFKAQKIYLKGFSISELFPINSVGIVTARDAFTIHENKTDLINTIDEFLNLDDEEARKRFNLGKDVRDWKVKYARKDLMENYPSQDKFIQVNYRPFDNRWSFYTGNSKGFYCYPRREVMQHLINNENIALAIGRQGQVIGTDTWDIVSITNKIMDFNYYRRGGQLVFPLYLYPEQSDGIFSEESREPNFNQEILDEIIEKLNLPFVSEESDKTGDGKQEFAPVDLLDYIYAVLHSPTYRETYKEFLKIDFPRVPYPTDQEKFWKLVELGKQIREIHLLESPRVEDYITRYPVGGDNIVSRRLTKNSPGFIPEPDNPEIGKVWINEEQYFENVPLTAWEFYIGGYQPAQKWLKDRRDRTLDFEDILHYQKIIVALTETARLMEEVDAVDVVNLKCDNNF